MFIGHVLRVRISTSQMSIPQSFVEAFERVKELVVIFSRNEQRYLAAGYSEAQARLDFIDKFWIALGWDVNRQVVPERIVSVYFDRRMKGKL